MKFPSYLALFAAALASVTAHVSIKNPLPRGHPLNPNAAVKDFACIVAPLNGGAGCAPKPFPCGGYPVDSKITQVLKAGEVINVSFWNPNLPNGPETGDETANQARHNGGLCEFSLSYDGGKSYTVIATYHKTCPDIFFDWKVKIPDTAPSCDTPGKCLFSWTWINAEGNHEFYQNCADVKIQGTATDPLPIKDITRANLPPKFSKIVTPDGDPANSGNAKGSGPQRSDVEANLGGFTPIASTKTPTETTTSVAKRKSRATSPAKTAIAATTPGADGKFDTISPTKTATAATTSGANGKSNTTNRAKIATATTPSAANGKSDITSPTKTAGASGKSNTTNRAKTATVTTSSATSSSTIPTDGSCTINGEMECVDGSNFTTCTNGVLVTRKCPLGTVCIQNNIGSIKSIQCGYQSRKF